LVKLPECGSKIGIILSVGKPTQITHVESEVMSGVDWPPVSTGLEEKLQAANIDPSLLNIEIKDDFTIVSPKKFLGDLWGPINDVMKSLGVFGLEKS